MYHVPMCSWCGDSEVGSFGGSVDFCSEKCFIRYYASQAVFATTAQALALATYEAATAPARATYKAAEASARATCEAATALAWATYEAATALARATYEATTTVTARATVRAAVDRLAEHVEDPAWATYKAAEASAWATYEAALAPAQATPPTTPTTCLSCGKVGVNLKCEGC